MTKLEQLGKDMIEQGQLSEYHQKRSRDPQNKFADSDAYMYLHHHERYIKLKKEYEEKKK